MPAIRSLVTLLTTTLDSSVRRSAERSLLAIGAASIDPLCERAGRAYPSDRDLCLRIVTKIPDPLLREKMACIRRILTQCDDDPEMDAMVGILCALKTRTIIPMLHLLREEAAQSPDLTLKITSVAREMGQVSVEPIIQLFRYDDETYYESVLPVLQSQTPYALHKLKYAQFEEEEPIRRYAEKAERAITGTGTRNPGHSGFRDAPRRSITDSDESMADEYVPDEYIPEEYAPEEYAPDEYIPEEYVPDEYGQFWYENYDELYDLICSR
jgi:hypothetical protein